MPVDPFLDPFALGVLLIDQSLRGVRRLYVGELHSLLIASRLFVAVQSTMPFYVVDILVRLSISFIQLVRETRPTLSITFQKVFTFILLCLWFTVDHPWLSIIVIIHHH